MTVKEQTPRNGNLRSKRGSILVTSRRSSIVLAPSKRNSFRIDVNVLKKRGTITSRTLDEEGGETGKSRKNS